MKRPNVKDYFDSMQEVHNESSASPKLFAYSQSTDLYCDYLEDDVINFAAFCLWTANKAFKKHGYKVQEKQSHIETANELYLKYKKYEKHNKSEPF